MTGFREYGTNIACSLPPDTWIMDTCIHFSLVVHNTCDDQPISRCDPHTHTRAHLKTKSSNRCANCKAKNRRTKRQRTQTEFRWKHSLIHATKLLFLIFFFSFLCARPLSSSRRKKKRMSVNFTNLHNLSFITMAFHMKHKQNMNILQPS